MFISIKNYNRLVSHNKNLTKEVNELQQRVKCLTITNEEHYKRAIKWKHNYDKMRELYDIREIKRLIVEQRDAEIEALKHMLERLEVEQEEIRKENEYLKAKCERFGEPSQRIVCELSKRGIHY